MTFDLSHARWLAPEYNKSVGVISHFPTEEADVWSFGLLCLEVFTGEDPYSSHSDLAVHALLREGIIPEYPGSTAVGLSPRMWETMQYCWRVDPNERPSISEIKSAIYALIPPHVCELSFVSHHQGACLPLSDVKPAHRYRAMRYLGRRWRPQNLLWADPNQVQSTLLSYRFLGFIGQITHLISTGKIANGTRQAQAPMPWLPCIWPAV
jgi:hypothetical protein